MPELPTRAAFTECQGDRFRILPEAGQPVEVELLQVTSPAWRSPLVPDRPFSGVFRGPPAPVLPHRTYQVEHDRLGGHALFLVPIGPDAAGMRYEAVFN